MRPPSAVDNETGPQFSVLAHIAHGRTIIIIAHRPSTIVHADTIAVLENGRIIERGSHTALLSLKRPLLGPSGRSRQAA